MVAVAKYNNEMYAYDTFNRNIHKVLIFWKNNNCISVNKNRSESYYENDCGQRHVGWLISYSIYLAVSKLENLNNVLLLLQEKYNTRHKQCYF